VPAAGASCKEALLAGLEAAFNSKSSGDNSCDSTEEVSTNMHAEGMQWF
jgi:hypothetical protein